MRILITISLFFWAFSLLAQNSDSLGIDDNPILNEREVELLNSLLAESRIEFDFTDKKVAFITGSSGRKIVSKSNYFKHSVIPWIEKDSKPQIFMVKLTFCIFPKSLIHTQKIPSVAYSLKIKNDITVKKMNNKQPLTSDNEQQRYKNEARYHTSKF